MNIHEYQAKELLVDFGVSILPGRIARSADQAVHVAAELGGSQWVVKAQIHSGGRGKAGGIKVCRSAHEVYEAAGAMLGTTLVTDQTGPRGKFVRRVYVEMAAEFTRELYLGLVLDRKIERIRVLASLAGGMEIEEIARNQPGSILQEHVDPAIGLRPFQARELAFGLGLNMKQVSQAVVTILGCYRAFRDLDATMVEINPLVVTADDRVLALDAKMSFDDNALFRRARVAEMRDPKEEDAREAAAAEFGMNYVGLTGDIGCIINGAGLAMATMDMIKHVGGEPANFLDVGGGASPERVEAAFRLVMSDQNVKAVLVNIFAGINRCDWVAKGVVQGARDLRIPLVVRLAGTNVAEGEQIIRASGLPIISADSLADAAQKTVWAARSATR